MVRTQNAYEDSLLPLRARKAGKEGDWEGSSGGRREVGPDQCSFPGVEPVAELPSFYFTGVRREPGRTGGMAGDFARFTPAAPIELVTVRQPRARIAPRKIRTSRGLIGDRGPRRGERTTGTRSRPGAMMSWPASSGFDRRVWSKPSPRPGRHSSTGVASEGQEKEIAGRTVDQDQRDAISGYSVSNTAMPREQHLEVREGWV